MGCRSMYHCVCTHQVLQNTCRHSMTMSHSHHASLWPPCTLHYHSSQHDFTIVLPPIQGFLLGTSKVGVVLVPSEQLYNPNQARPSPLIRQLTRALNVVMWVGKGWHFYRWEIDVFCTMVNVQSLGHAWRYVVFAWSVTNILSISCGLNIIWLFDLCGWKVFVSEK